VDLHLNINGLMRTRGILHKMLLDSSRHRTPEEIELLSEFLEWLHAFQDAEADGYTQVTVKLHRTPHETSP
jgi:hypothetical protein